LGFPRAVSFAIPMNPVVMAGIRHGPVRSYAEEFTRANEQINTIVAELEQELRTRGHRAMRLAASSRIDPERLTGEFPHKTAATRAGLGWIGRNCQLVTVPYGPWVRLGTVFTDLDARCSDPRERSACGTCGRCVEACPARALRGTLWHPGLPREEILDAHVCDRWKKESFPQYLEGRLCGICSSVCPHGTKTLKARTGKD
jgi:epoxyqueuosine reductase